MTRTSLLSCKTKNHDHLQSAKAQHSIISKASVQTYKPIAKKIEVNI